MIRGAGSTLHDRSRDDGLLLEQWREQLILTQGTAQHVESLQAGRGTHLDQPLSEKCRHTRFVLQQAGELG
jgi:hypothetical protein